MGRWWQPSTGTDRRLRSFCFHHAGDVRQPWEGRKTPRRRHWTSIVRNVPASRTPTWLVGVVSYDFMCCVRHPGHNMGHSSSTSPSSPRVATTPATSNTNRKAHQCNYITVSCRGGWTVAVLHYCDSCGAPGGNAPVMSCGCRLAPELIQLKLPGAWASLRSSQLGTCTTCTHVLGHIALGSRTGES